MRSVLASTLGVLLLVPAAVPPGTAGQELPVRAAPQPSTSSSSSSSSVCPNQRAEPDTPSGRASPEDARALARGAREAALLGEPEQALDLLRRATERDPGSAELAYRRARAHDELGQGESAARWYCRYLALTPESQDDADVRDRLAELRSPAPAGGGGPAAAALEHHREGVALLEQGRLEEAEERFTEALRADSALAEARYNRGLARGAAGRLAPAAEDLRAYLDARPDPPDRDRVRETIEFLEDPPQRFDPTRAALLGAAVPGAGHFYTGKPMVGTALFGVAAAAGVTAVLYERVEVTCRVPPEDGICPEDQVHSTTSDRPALVPGLLTVAMAAGVSAITAHLDARSRNEEAARLRISGGDGAVADGGGTVRVLPPTASASPDGVAVELLRLRF